MHLIWYQVFEISGPYYLVNDIETSYYRQSNAPSLRRTPIVDEDVEGELCPDNWLQRNTWAKEKGF